LEFHQNKYHLRNEPDMRRQYAKATNQYAQGWPTGATLQPLTGRLHGHALQEAVTRNPKLEVSGSRTRWSLVHVARSAGQHLVCYQLNQVGKSSLDPYKYRSPVGGIQNTTFYL
jgi:hypothetical protein